MPKLKDSCEISLIIPCYNEADNLELLIENCKSLFLQKNIEVILVDNGSTDNTLEILDNLSMEYPFKYVVVEKNQGYGYGILAGLREASCELMAWTHADLQTDPNDILYAIKCFKDVANPEKLFVKGARYSRPILDAMFTIGMSIFETLLLKTKMWDINAQPTAFHRSFYETWKSPPNDFSLDLFAYFMAKNKGLVINRFPVLFSDRIHGVSNWNISWSNKYRFIKRTLQYSFLLNRKIKK